MTTELELVKVDAGQLDEVVSKSGLAIQEASEIKAAYLPFLSQLAEIQSIAGEIDFENPGANDEIKARTARIATVKVRTGAEKQKDERKKMYLLRGNMEQASYNLIATACKMTEEVFFRVEKAREIAEKARKEQLRIERTEKLMPYVGDCSVYLLGEMTEAAFETTLAGAIAQYEAKKAAEKKAEEERIAEEKAEAEEREKQRLENVRLKKEAEERERQIIEERRKVKEEQDRKDAELIKEREKAEAERRKLEEKARKEREERERVEAELRAAKEAEEKAKQDEIRRQKAAEKKARLAPDKDKLLAFAQSLNDLQRPEVKSIEAAAIAANINTELVRIAKYIRENAEKL